MSCVVFSQTRALSQDPSTPLTLFTPLLPNTPLSPHKTSPNTPPLSRIQIPEVIGGAEGQAVYLDTEGSFVAERAVSDLTNISL